MRSTTTNELEYYLRQLADHDLDELLARVLAEMRARDSENLKSDLLTSSKKLPLINRPK